jgi:phage anti-repressor protein/phage antirepressor YoqD-like protein
MSNFPEIKNHYELTKAVSARDLYTFLEINRDFSTWITGRIDQFDFSHGEDFISDTIPQNGGKGGRPLVEYFITIDMAKELAMVERNEQGKKVRKYFIECEKQLRNPAPQFNIPKTLPEALRLAADLADQLAIAAPKVAVYELLADRKGDVSTTIVAKELGTTAIKLNKFLRDNGIKWLNADLPKAGYEKYFNVVADVKNGHEFTQCLITPVGQIEIAKLWNN